MTPGRVTGKREVIPRLPTIHPRPVIGRNFRNRLQAALAVGTLGSLRVVGTGRLLAMLRSPFIRPAFSTSVDNLQNLFLVSYIFSSPSLQFL